MNKILIRTRGWEPLFHTSEICNSMINVIAYTFRKKYYICCSIRRKWIFLHIDVRVSLNINPGRYNALATHRQSGYKRTNAQRSSTQMGRLRFAITTPVGRHLWQRQRRCSVYLACKNVGIQVLLNFNTARFGMDEVGKRVTHPSSTRAASGEMHVSWMETLQTWWFVLNFLMPNDSQISWFALQRPSSAVILRSSDCANHIGDVKSCLEWHAYKEYYTKNS